MTRITTLLCAGAAAVALAGCDLLTYNELGSSVDEGAFGNPTMNNFLVQTGQRSAEISLSRRFAAEVPSTINFAFDSATLSPEARAALDQQANFIRQFPELRFSVFGHTDLVGSPAYNKSLGLRRANAAVNYLVRQGVERGRLEALVSFGETRPLIQTADREVRNRRTVTDVSGFVKNSPTNLDGKYAEVVYREFIAGAVPPPVIQAERAVEGGDGE